MTKDSRKDSIPVDGTKRVTRSMFVRALATSQFVLQIVEGPDAGREFILTPKPIRIGKALDNDLVLSDESVSKYHAVIEKDPGGWLIRDLESTNGTTLNAIPINEGFIPVRSLIGLGNSTLKLVPANEKSRLPPSEKTEFGSMLGGSLAMREVFALLERFAPTDLPVFINGETGTGKELAAQGLHQQSPRGKNPFVVFDCSAVVSNLVESELFGHEKGAFTGAETSRAGCFEQAQGGTLFIDEIGELPLDLQPKLLRVLETKEVRRVGGNDGRKVDVRIIAATHRDLPQMVQEQKFREDLYYRLAVVKVTLPPLRERLEDIPPIVERMVAQYNENLPRGRTAIEGFENVYPSDRPLHLPEAGCAG